MENNDIVTLCIAIGVVAFVVLCIFLIQLLRTAQRSLITAQGALQEVKETVEGLQGEVRKLAGSVNDVADDLRGKLQSVDPLFDAVQDVGVLLSEVTGTARIATKNLSQTIRQKAAAMEPGGHSSPSWLQWAAAGSRLFIGLRNGWMAREHSRSYKDDSI